MRDNLINLTSDLIRFRSVLGNPEAKKEQLDFCVTEFKDIPHVHIQRFHSNGIESLVVTTQDTKTPDLMLVGHLDVVEADDAAFHPRVEGNQLYGRGSGDMKGAVACMMLAFKHFASSNNRPNIGIMLTNDEEVGGLNGVRYLLEDEHYAPKFSILPDSSTGLDKIVTEQKGLMIVKVVAEGTSAHGSRPFLGDNAIDKLIRIYESIRRQIPELKENKWQTTLSLNMLYAGKAPNQVPDLAEMLLDIRYIHAEDRQWILDLIQSSLLDATMEITVEGHPYHESSTSSSVQSFIRATEKCIDRKVSIVREEGASDARFFTKNNLHVIVNGVSKHNMHGKNESVDIAELEEFYNILVEFIRVL